MSEKIKAVIATKDAAIEGMISRKHYSDAQWQALQDGEVIQDGLNSAGVVYLPTEPDYLKGY
jgi:hypothetical protein